MKKRTTTLFCLVSAIFAFGQIKHDYTWIMGTNGLPNNPDEPNNHWGVNVFDFNNGKLNIDRRYQDTDFFLTNASMSDTSGNLLFYTNGCGVFLPDGEVMANGTGLNPGIVYSNGNCPQHGNPVHQGALVLPFTDNDSLYLLFHKAFVLGDAAPFLVYPDKLYVTTINMKGDSGSGAVVSKNELVLHDTLNEDLQAVRHANGVDWWVFTSSLNDNLYYRMLVTEDGVMDMAEQAVGPISDPWVGARSVFSPSGEKYARYDRINQLLLYDFDRETGLLSNLIRLEADTTLDGYLGSVTISPSGRFLYVNSSLQLYQFDLEASDIQASRLLLGEYDGFEYLDIFPATFGQMQLAPDCKIYFPTNSATPYFHVINYPDRKGHACGFEQRGLRVPASNIGSIPNFPNYRLGTGHPVCDSTIQLVVHSIPVPPPQREVVVYPNPASGHVTIEMPQVLASESEWSLYNGVGQRVLFHKIERGGTRAEAALEGLPHGLYFWEMRTEGKRVGSGKLIVSH